MYQPAIVALFISIGMNKDTTKEHIVRAVLESIAFRFYQLYQIAFSEIRIPVKSSIKADGGVTKNDFVLELIASLTEHDSDRAEFSDMSAVGAAYFAGLGAGIWKSKDELRNFRDSRNTFKPNKAIKNSYSSRFLLWQNAVKRSLRWYIEF